MPMPTIKGKKTKPSRVQPEHFLIGEDGSLTIDKAGINNALSNQAQNVTPLKTGISPY